MKVVIIGGGIAGMTMGAFLQRRDVELVICEKMADQGDRGHAFLMHSDALAILRELLPEGCAFLPGKAVNYFSQWRPGGEEIRKEELNSWHCMRRSDLTGFLTTLLKPRTIIQGRAFSHFVREQGRIVAAAFSNGEVESGDIFIGADGANSKVREAVFGPVDLSPVAVKEIVGSSRSGKLAKRYAHTFVKIQEATRGLAFGLIPTDDQESVWFMQYDPRIADTVSDEPGDIRAFCFDMLRDFPAVVKEALTGADLSKTYIWNTKDFDLLASFHQENVVLLGDAAHLTLPFTSAGTTNAIIGAKTLSACLEKAGCLGNAAIQVKAVDVEAAFREYYRVRSFVVGEHIRLGRKLREDFLCPGGTDKLPMPFLSPQWKDRTRKRIHAAEGLTVNYFTDPICSTCWIIQPAWKKLLLEYGHCLDIRYVMGGLLPSWKDCKGRIQSPSDAARHWKEVADAYSMPIDAGVWTEDPLSSSFPPSIAFKAAQLQDQQKAILFLRRIREMIFLEKKNITKWRFLETAALEVGLDTARFRKDYTGAARPAFEADLALATALDVVSFPTLTFANGAGEVVRLKGYQHYTDFEQAVLQLAPSAVKVEIDRQPESLFRSFPTMVEQEFAILSNLMRKDARKLLQQLNREGYIDKVVSHQGVLWSWILPD
jgi:2-polyprenyl-6-methoxyphenol hydroxylase-like FAD-dependent oxidoreductase/predicted DsbA family dithiol-disulfide isomerase